jgi:hypothetical protein
MLQISASPVGSRGPEGGSATPDHGQLTEELHHWLKPGTEVVLLFDRYVARTAILWLEEPGSDARIEGCVRLLGVSARTDSDRAEASKASK